MKMSRGWLRTVLDCFSPNFRLFKIKITMLDDNEGIYVFLIRITHKLIRHCLNASFDIFIQHYIPKELII